MLSGIPGVSCVSMLSGIPGVSMLSEIPGVSMLSGIPGAVAQGSGLKVGGEGRFQGPPPPLCEFLIYHVGVLSPLTIYNNLTERLPPRNLQ